MRKSIGTVSVSDTAKAVVRRNTEEVQSQGKFELFEELFAEDFVDHTTQPGTLRTKQACASCAPICARRFLIFTPKFTGSWQTAILSWHP